MGKERLTASQVHVIKQSSARDAEDAIAMETLVTRTIFGDVDIANYM